MKCKFCGNTIPANSIFCNLCGERQIKERRKKDEVKIPAPRQLPSGKWRIELRAEGQSGTFDTQAEAEAWARAMRAGFIAEKKAKSCDGVTLSEAIDKYVADRYHTLSPSTRRGYETIRRTRLQSVMHKPLSSIDNWQLQINAESAAVSAKTVKNIWYLVTPVLRANNLPVPEIKLPQIVKNTRAWLEPEQITRFVKAMKGEPCEIPALLALHSLRRSEICALTWDNIDLSRDTIRIEGSAVLNEKNKITYKKTNKNSASQRTIKILIPELHDALVGESIIPGKRIVQCNINTPVAQINRVCEKEGLPKVGIHGLRHSFASLAYHLGLSELETMEMGGWSDYATMRKIYTHLAASDRLNAENAMSDFYAKK